jgi:hypothetical protein
MPRWVALPWELLVPGTKPTNTTVRLLLKPPLAVDTTPASPREATPQLLATVAAVSRNLPTRPLPPVVAKKGPSTVVELPRDSALLASVQVLPCTVSTGNTSRGPRATTKLGWPTDLVLATNRFRPQANLQGSITTAAMPLWEPVRSVLVALLATVWAEITTGASRAWATRHRPHLRTTANPKPTP